MEVRVFKERWHIKGGFTISRGTMTESNVFVIELHENGMVGRGECEPHESDVTEMDKAEELVESIREVIEFGLNREALSKLLPAGPVRNAIDCALWDLECKRRGTSVWNLVGVTRPESLSTAYTISLMSVGEMAKRASENCHRPLLKLKLGSQGSLERVKAVREAAPKSRLIVDANEAFCFEQLQELAPEFAKLGVELIEQPMPAGRDQELVNYNGPVPLCADESCLDRSSLPFVSQRYQFINIKLDKTGGLTEALALASEAKKLGLRLMVGCMTGTSLAMAPAMVIGCLSEFCDLDGPLLLQEDRKPCLFYKGSELFPDSGELWG